MYVCQEFPGVGIPLQLPNSLGVGQCEKMEEVGVVSIGQCDPDSDLAPVLRCARRIVVGCGGSVAKSFEGF